MRADRRLGRLDRSRCHTNPHFFVKPRTLTRPVASRVRLCVACKLNDKNRFAVTRFLDSSIPRFLLRFHEKGRLRQRAKRHHGDITGAGSARDQRLIALPSVVGVVGVSPASSFRSCVTILDKGQLVTRRRDVSRIDGQFVQGVVDSELDEDSAFPL